MVGGVQVDQVRSVHRDYGGLRVLAGYGPVDFHTIGHTQLACRLNSVLCEDHHASSPGMSPDDICHIEFVIDLTTARTGRSA